MTPKKQMRYIPAFGFQPLTPVYDPLLKWVLHHHHLTTADKARAFQEARRVLKPGGELHVVDFGKPHNPAAFLISLVMRRLERSADNIAGKLPELIQRAGFTDVAETTRFMSVFGTLALYQARKF